MVTWKKWLGYGLYKKVWSVVGKRQWTYIMRDFAYQNPLLLIIASFSLGMTLRPFMDWDDLWKFFAGVLLAHLFWGTKWKKGQGGL